MALGHAEPGLGRPGSARDSEGLAALDGGLGPVTAAVLQRSAGRALIASRL